MNKQKNKQKVKNKLFLTIGTTVIPIYAFSIASLVSIANSSNAELLNVNTFSDVSSSLVDVEKDVTKYNFLNLAELKTRIDEQNVNNLYNINGSSIFYTSKKTSTSPKKIDSIVSVKSIGNSVNWVLDDTKIKNIIKVSRVAKNPSYSSKEITDITFHKSEYSISSRNFFLNISATFDRKTSNVIIKINENTGDATIYYDAEQVEDTKLTSSSINYKNVQFNQFVVKQDNAVSPTLLLIQSTYQSNGGYNKFIVYEVQAKMANQAGTITSSIISTSSGGFSPSDSNYMNSGNKILVTNSKWLNGGLFILTQHKPSNAANPSPRTAAYGFSFRGNSLQSPFQAEASTLSNKSKDTFYNLWNKGNEVYLIARQEKTIGTNASATGEVLVQKVNMSINQNNVNISIDRTSKQIPYFNGGSLLGITEVYNQSHLPPNSSYIALSKNNVLVVLDSRFNYLDQVSLVDVLPTGSEIISIQTFGSTYLLYLSNGQVLVYNNSGFIGNNRSLATFGLESPARISFFEQSAIKNGVSYFTNTTDDFQRSIQTNTSAFFEIEKSYNIGNPKLSFEFDESNIENKEYNKELTVRVYQELRPINNSAAVVETDEKNTLKIYLGEKTYKFYLGEARVEAKNIEHIPDSIKKNLPSRVIEMYKGRESELINVLLNVSNINLYDKIGSEDNKNLTITLKSNDLRGVLDIIASVAYQFGTSQSSRTFNVSIRGFASTNVDRDQLKYKLNPKEKTELSQKYFNTSPKDFKVNDAIDNFITLSPFLKTQKYNITMIPDEEKGTIIFTITFDFNNKNLKFDKDSSAMQVTDNSITWSSEQVFKSSPTINENLLLTFNTFSQIQEKNAAIVLQQPTKIYELIESKTNIKDKVAEIERFGFVTMSKYIKENISGVIISSVNDFQGEFTLQIVLRQALAGTLKSSYTYDYSGFAKAISRSENVFNISFLTKEQYLKRFFTTNENNIFNLVPSAVTSNDLLIRNGNDLSANGILGGLISFSENALNSQFNITLTPENNTGKLLITIVFGSFLELDKNGAITSVSNKKIIHYYDGFKKTNQNGIYYLNWRSFDSLEKKNNENNEEEKKLGTIKASEFVDQISSQSSFAKLLLFGDLSSAAINHYRLNDDMYNISIVTNDDKGTVNVIVNFSNWNHSSAIVQFSQSFSGFKVPEEKIEEEITNYSPSESEFVVKTNIDQIKAKYLPSELTPQILSNFFSFKNNVLNQRDKKVYFVFDESKGRGQLLFFIKKDTIAQPATSETISTNSKIFSSENENSKNVEFISIRTFSDEVVNNAPRKLDISMVPFEQLASEGYAHLKRGDVTLEGFKTFAAESNRNSSIISLSLAVSIPLVVLLPFLIFLIKFKDRSFINFVERKITLSLRRTKKEEEEREKLDE